MQSRRVFIKTLLGAGVISAFPDILFPFHKSFSALTDGNVNTYYHQLKLVHAIIQKNSELDELDLKGQTLTEMSKLYLKSGYRQDALKTLSDAGVIAEKLNFRGNDLYMADSIDSGIYLTKASDIYEESAKTCFEIGDNKQALKLISKALKILQGLSKETDNSIYTLGIINIADMLHENGEKEMALNLLNSSLINMTDGYLFPKSNYSLKRLVESYCNIGLHNKAEEIADKIAPSYFTYGDISGISSLRPDALSYIAKSYAGIGLRDKAYQLLKDIHLQLPKENNKDIAIAYAELDEWEKAFDEIKAANKISEELKEINCPYIEIANIAIQKNRRDVALKALKELTKIMEDHDWGDVKTELLIEMADIYLSLGEDFQSVKTLKHALEYIERRRTEAYFYLSVYVEDLSKSANVLIKMDNLAEAKKLLHKAFNDIVIEDDAYEKIESLMIVLNAYIGNEIAMEHKEKEYLKNISSAMV